MWCFYSTHCKILSANLTLRECKWTRKGPFALSQSQINTQDFTVWLRGIEMVLRIVEFQWYWYRLLHFWYCDIPTYNCMGLCSHGPLVEKQWDVQTWNACIISVTCLYVLVLACSFLYTSMRKDVSFSLAAKCLQQISSEVVQNMNRRNRLWGPIYFYITKYKLMLFSKTYLLIHVWLNVLIMG